MGQRRIQGSDFDLLPSLCPLPPSSQRSSVSIGGSPFRFPVPGPIGVHLRFQILGSAGFILFIPSIGVRIPGDLGVLGGETRMWR